MGCTAATMSARSCPPSPVIQPHVLTINGAGAEGGSEILDRRPPPEMNESNVSTLIYVDNEVFVANRPGAGSKLRATAASALGAAGLPPHDVEDDVRLMMVLGLELDGLRSTVRLSVERRWRLQFATGAFLRRRLVSGRELEVLIGHFTHAMLINRPALSVFRSTYDFVRRHYHTPSRLWPSSHRAAHSSRSGSPVGMLADSHMVQQVRTVSTAVSVPSTQP